MLAAFGSFDGLDGRFGHLPWVSPPSPIWSVRSTSGFGGSPAFRMVCRGGPFVLWWNTREGAYASAYLLALLYLNEALGLRLSSCGGACYMPLRPVASLIGCVGEAPPLRLWPSGGGCEFDRIPPRAAHSRAGLPALYCWAPVPMSASAMWGRVACFVQGRNSLSPDAPLVLGGKLAAPPV